MTSHRPKATPPLIESQRPESRRRGRAESHHALWRAVPLPAWLGSRIVFFVLAIAMLLPALLQVLLGPDDHDVAWYLYVAAQVMDGARLYVDLVEINPPLIVAFSVPAVLIARAFGFSDILVFELSVLALVVVSLTLCAAVLRRLLQASQPVGRGYLLLLTLFVLAAVPGTSNVFAQREHIMLILLLPYLLAVAVRATRLPLDKATAVLIGLIAGLGVALKPYFLLPWFLVEAYLVFRLGGKRAWLRPENITLGCILALYAFCVAVVTPEYLAVARLAREAYSGFLATPYTQILFSRRAQYVWLAFAAVVLIPSDEQSRELRRVLFFGTAGLLGAALLQRKGWPYHLYPSVAGATLLLAIALRDAIRSGRTLASRAGLAITAAALVLIGAKVGQQTLQVLRPTDYDLYMTRLLPRMTALTREHADGESIFGLSSVPFPMFPVVNYTGVRWGGRFHHLWPVSGLYAERSSSGSPLHYRSLEEMGGAERFVHDAVVSDMLQSRPRLLFVLMAPSDALPRPGFDYVAYFSRDPRFAQLMNEYDVLDRIGDYRVYKRR